MHSLDVVVISGPWYSDYACCLSITWPAGSTLPALPGNLPCNHKPPQSKWPCYPSPVVLSKWRCIYLLQHFTSLYNNQWLLYNYTPELEHNGFHVHHTSITNNVYECMCMLMQCITLHSRELFTYVRTHVLHVDVLKCGFFHNYINLPLLSCRLTHRYVSWNMVYFPRKTVLCS